jgi:RHS repeat-associated protein
VTSARNRFVSLIFVTLFSVVLSILGAAFAYGGTFTSFGPRLYERGTAAPAPVANSFTVPNPATSYTLKIYNGGRAGIRTGERVSSAVITLNGASIVTPQNFNEKTGEISFPIKVLATNQLSVELRSRPGSLLVLEVVGEDNAAPSLSFTAPNGLVVMAGRALHEIDLQYADPLSGLNLSTLQVLIDGVDLTATCTIGASSTTCPMPTIYRGQHVATARIRDRAGNLATANHPFEIDNKPVANAGPDQTLFVGNMAQLDGSASSDVDGDLLSFQWALVSRPQGSTAALSDPADVKPFFVIDKPGNYELALVVNDGIVDSLPDTVIISTQNSRPIANAGPDQTVPLGSRAFLDGRGSSDVDGDTVSYRWRITSKPANSTTTLDDPNTSQPSFIADKPGSYTVELIVNDGAVDGNPDEVVITTENSRPVADAGPDREAPVGDTVQLDGSNSSDADGDPLTYFWSFTNKPPTSTASFSSQTIVKPTFVPDLPGLYIIQLIVSDSKADSAPDTANITVFVPVPPNRNPVAVDDQGPAIITAQNSARTFFVLNNDFDPDGDPIAITNVTQGTNGTVTNTATTTTYTPNAGFHGIDSFTYSITDNRGGTAQAKVTVIVDQPPSVNAGPGDAITLPQTATLNGSATDDGHPNPPGAVTTLWTQMSGPGTVVFGNASAVKTTASFSQDGIYVLRLTANDGFLSASSDVTITVHPVPPVIPPDPAANPPSIDATVPMALDKATEFLYTGSNPIQTGVAPGTIVANRAAVIRGRVLDRGNAPLSGVTITILNHPEFGQTISRNDGMFDMAVNGGGPLTINYKKSGLLPVQRQVRTAWQDFSIAPDVVMIARDSEVTTVQLNANIMQVARGSIAGDIDTDRRATLLIPPGTQAQIYRPDGSTQSVNSLNLRLTEYTIGANGPNAMPGELPPNSGYTYAVELGADEAITKIGGKDVLLSQPVYFYVDNFLGFPVGENVPTGFYDNDQSAWVASDNGRIVQVVGLSGELANLDTNGDGVADNDATLGITDVERRHLALLYQPGKSLWRVPLTHLSTWDANWGNEPDCNPEIDPCASEGDPEPEEQLENSCTQAGNSIIECQNQVLRETVGLVGTGMTLHYRSERVAEIDIPLSGNKLPPRLQQIELEILVAGRLFKQTFAPKANQRTTFLWDGKDAYGRTVLGTVPVTIRVGNRFQAVYQQTGRFGYNGNGVVISGAGAARQGLTIWRTWTDRVSAWDRRNVGLGGWTPSVHHTYDARDQVLHRGDGVRQSAKAVGLAISTTAGLGTETACQGGDGGPASQAAICPEGLAFGPDGSLYIATPTANRVRRVAPNGIISTFAGTGQSCSTPTGICGDGGLATEAQLSRPFSLAVGPDGGLYIGELDSHRVRKVRTDGIIINVAGTGVPCNSSTAACGDDGSAKLAQINAVHSLAISPDNVIYMADAELRRIRRIGPDGIIATVAGRGIVCSSPTAACGDGGPARLADFADPRGLAIGRDGSIYIADKGLNRVRRVTPDGVIRTIAGTGTEGFAGDSGPAIQATLNNPKSVAVGPDDTVYIVDEFNRRIRSLRPNGSINTYAGNGAGISEGDGGPALRAGFKNLSNGLTISPDGTVYAAEPGNGGFVRRISPYFANLPAGGFAVPSESGAEVYLFNDAGRHLQTIDGLNGAQRYTFAYDSSGRLRSITDRNGNVTVVERDGNGNSTAVISPFGQRTELGTNTIGYLSRITNPAGESVLISYTQEGWLSTFTNPRGFVSNYSYDLSGRLIAVTDPTGATKTLTRSGTNLDYTTTLTTSLGRTTRYRVERLETKDIRLTTTDPSGSEIRSLRAQNGQNTVTYPDGTQVSQLLGPDPRWRMLAPLVKSLTMTTPSGKVSTSSSQRVVSLAVPGDPLSLRSYTESATINGRLYSMSYDNATKTFTRTSPTGRQTTAIIDAQGRVLQRQVGGLAPLTYEYDSRGRPTKVTHGTGIDSRIANFAYNSQSFLDSITDSAGRVTRFNYDAIGRIVQQITPDSRIVNIAYDANGNPTSVTPPGRPPHTSSYSPVDLALSYTPPDIGPGSEATVNSVNSDRQLTRVALPNGQNIDLNYEAGSGRLSNVTIARGEVAYSYASPSGNVASIVAPDESLAFNYDGSIPTRATWTGAVTGDLSHSYDNNFRAISESLNGIDSVAFQYDNDNLLTGVGSLSISRNAQNGLITGTTLGMVTDAFAYSALGEMTSYSASSGGTSVFSTQFSRDQLGRITQKTETIGGVADTFNYSYDLAGRLSEVRKNGSVTSTYSYDANGNRLSGPNSNTTYTYDDQDRLLSVTNSGAVITLPVGRQIEYIVDGGNRRIAKKVNGAVVQKFLYSDGLRPIAELDANNNVVSRFVYSTGVNVPAYMIKSGATYRFVTDHLGSPRLLVDVTSGMIAQRIDYDEFGKVINDTNPGFQPFGFAGGLYDNERKLVRFGARDYNPETGRWTTKDPIGFSSGTNLYNYADNDPVNLFDPLGTDHTRPGYAPGPSGTITGVPPGGPAGYGAPNLGTAPTQPVPVQTPSTEPPLKFWRPGYPASDWGDRAYWADRARIAWYNRALREGPPSCPPVAPAAPPSGGFFFRVGNFMSGAVTWIPILNIGFGLLDSLINGAPEYHLPYCGSMGDIYGKCIPSPDDCAREGGEFTPNGCIN